MAYVVAATWTAKQDEQERIRGVIEAMTGPSRDEKGCLLYQGHRSTEERARFFLYEAYVDEAAYQAHTETPHFTELVVEGAIPRLNSRERVFYETLEP